MGPELRKVKKGLQRTRKKTVWEQSNVRRPTLRPNNTNSDEMSAIHNPIRIQTYLK